MSELRQVHESMVNQARETAEIKDVWTVDAFIERNEGSSYDNSFKEALESIGTI